MQHQSRVSSARVLNLQHLRDKDFRIVYEPLLSITAKETCPGVLRNQVPHEVRSFGADEESGEGIGKRQQPGTARIEASVLVPSLMLASQLLSGCSGGMTVRPLRWSVTHARLCDGRKCSSGRAESCGPMLIRAD